MVKPPPPGLVVSVQRRQLSKRQENARKNIPIRDAELYEALASCMSLHCAFHGGQKAQTRCSV